MRKPKTAPQIFLSYAHEDKKIVEELYQKLQAAGFQPWMDSQNILPGEDWQKSIQNAIESSHFFLACLSNNSVNKRGVLQKEFKAALDSLQGMLENDIYLIPVRLDDCYVPDSMGRVQWVNLFEQDGFSRLEQAIKTGMQRRTEGPPPPPDGAEDGRKPPQPSRPKKLKPGTLAKIIAGSILGLVLAFAGLPWFYNRYIYRVPRPDLPTTCQPSGQPVRIGVSRLANCPANFQEQLINNWESDFSSPTSITQAIQSSSEAQSQTGFNVVVWGQCAQADSESIQLNFDLVTSRKPYYVFEPRSFQITDNLSVVTETGQALWRYQRGEYAEAAQLFSDLAKNNPSADLAFFEANGWLFAEQYERAIGKFENILQKPGSNQAGIYNNLGIALQNTSHSEEENPYQGLDQLGQAVKIAEDGRETDLELLARVNRSFLYTQRNDWEKALEDCETALKLNAQSALPHLCLARYDFSYYFKPAQLGLLPLNEINQQLSQAENMQDAPPLTHYMRAEWHLNQSLAEKQKAMEAYARYFAGMQYQACLKVDRDTLDSASRRIGEITTK